MNNIDIARRILLGENPTLELKRVLLASPHRNDLTD